MRKLLGCSRGRGWNLGKTLMYELFVRQTLTWYTRIVVVELDRELMHWIRRVDEL